MTEYHVQFWTVIEADNQKEAIKKAKMRVWKGYGNPHAEKQSLERKMGI